MLTIVEKVIFLKGVDVFEHLATSDLAHMAAITQQERTEEGQVLYHENEIADGMYIVVQGSVALTRSGEQVMVAKEKDAFGSWSLLDDERRVVTARVKEGGEVLVIRKDDFIDLLADHVQITQGILKAVVKRVRSLMEVVARS